MKIGVLTSSLSDLSLEEVIIWASAHGFGKLEVVCYPVWQEKEAYGVKTHIDVDLATDDKLKMYRDLLYTNNISISALNYHTNTIDLNLERRKKIVDHMKKTILIASKLGVDVVSAHIGRVFDQQATQGLWQKDIDFNFKQVMKVWPDIIHFAGDHGVKIAIENCPMLWPDSWPGGQNLMYSPAIMRRMFSEIPDKNFGLNYDPSHHAFQFIDYIRVIYEFADKIFHVHAKDVQIDQEMLYQDGILNAGFRWAKHRLPGLGMVDWKKVAEALYDIGYDNVLSIEHEDANWKATTELAQRGLLLAKRNLELVVI